MTDQPPTDPPADPPAGPVPPSPGPPVPPVPPSPVPPVSDPPTDGNAVSALTNAVNALIETVGGMQRSDTKPVRKPWTHWGSK